MASLYHLDKWLQRADPVEVFFATYAVLALAWVFYDAIRPSQPPRDRHNVVQDFRVLSEDALEYLERGGEIRHTRHHGGELVLTGHVVRQIPDAEVDESVDEIADESDE